MQLQLIIGGSGMGKSTYVYDWVIEESMKNPNINYIVLVPEQYTMETQYKLVSMHPRQGILNIDVLSFQRLSYRILEEVGAKTGRMLDDTGKNLIIRKVCEDIKKELVVLKGSVDKPGFVSQIKSAVSECMQYGITPQQLMQGADKVTSQVLAAKVGDIGRVYEGFLKYIENNYLTTEELYNYVSRRMAESEILENSVVVLDGFTGFTPVQYVFLKSLFAKVQKMLVTLTIDAKERYNVCEGMENLFYICKDTVMGLHRMADECRGSILPPVLLDDISRSRFANNEALYYLGQRLFAGNKARYKGDTDAIVIAEACGPRQELSWIASEIVRLTREKGLKYSDIAIIAGNIAEYGDFVSKLFKQNKIPVFVDEKRSLSGQVFVEFIMSLLEIFAENYSYDSVMTCLKTGFLPIAKDDVDLLDNYCLAMGIRGRSMWTKPFTRSSRNRKAYPVDLDRLNEIRELFIGNISLLEEALKDKESNARTMTEALESALESLGVWKHIEDKADIYEKEGNKEKAGVYRQVAAKTGSLFAQIKELLGEQQVQLTEYRKILEAGFDELKVGLIPSGTDYVLVGDMERTRIDNKKVVFFCGVNEGQVPKPSGGRNIITGSEKAALKENAGITLSPDEKEKAFSQRLYLYMNFTKPSWRLYVSYSTSNMDGKAQSKSYLINSLRRLFPDAPYLIIKDDVQSPWLVDVSARVEWSAPQLDAMLTAQEADELYKDNVTASITRMETFAKCAFSHFVNYGLSLREREEYEVSALDVGNVIHELMESVTGELKTEGRGFKNLTREEIDGLVDKYTNQIMENMGESVFKDNKRNEFLVGRIKEIAGRSIWAVGKQLENGEFEPFAFEMPFSIDTGDGNRYIGRIDRIDVCRDGNDIYVKVVDYKSGSESFDWPQLYHGIKLQLLTYMKAAREFLQQKYPGKNIIPAAALYYNTVNPIISVDNLNGSDMDEKLLGELVPTGVISCDADIIKLLDSQFFDKGGSTVIPVKLDKKTKSVKITMDTLSGSQFRDVENYVFDRLKESNDISRQGHIEINPVVLGNNTSCTYCRYRGICGFDEAVSPGRTKRLIAKDDVMGHITSRVAEKEN